MKTPKKAIKNVIDILIFAIVIGVGTYFKTAKFNIRPVLITDGIGHDMTRKQLVPSVYVTSLVFVVVPSFIILYSAIRKQVMGYYNAINVLTIWMVSFIVVMSITYLVTFSLKAIISRARPDFLGRIKTVDNGKNVGDIIDRTQNMIWNGSNACMDYEDIRSFPSGHTSFSFAALTLASIWWVVENYDTHMYSVVYIPPTFFLTLATYIGASRVVDFRHHASDVVVGGVIGVVFAVVVSFMTYGKLQKYRKPKENEAITIV